MNQHNGFASSWLWVGLIGLFACGTVAAKYVFLVDNDRESQAESSREYWQLDAQSTRKYTDELQKITDRYLHSASLRMREKSTQLTIPKAWCGSAGEMSAVLAKAQQLDLIDRTHLAADKAKIRLKIPASRSMSDRLPLKQLHLYVNPERQTNKSAPAWCLGTELLN